MATLAERSELRLSLDSNVTRRRMQIRTRTRCLNESMSPDEVCCFSHDDERLDPAMS